MPLLLIILLGAVEFARFAYVAIEVSNSAKAAAQYAAMNGGASSDSSGVTTAAQNDSANLLAPQVTATVVSSTCACSSAESTTVTCTSTCASGRIFQTVTVQTSATYTPLVTLPGFTSGITLNGKAKQLVLP
jgi:Flp pilus assembly protein TadG